MHSNTSQKVRTIIAQECGFDRKVVTNRTKFMANTDLSYFVCVDALYTLQHKLHVSLPESNYEKYQTVGGLVKDIVRQLNVHKR